MQTLASQVKSLDYTTIASTPLAKNHTCLRMAVVTPG